MSTSGADLSRLRARRWIVRSLQLAALVIGVLGMSTARVVVAGERELAASTAALEQGDPQGATVHARRAAGWYAPGAPHVAVAYERLRALARGAETHRRYDVALLAWRSIRSAAIETRWLVSPHDDERQVADRELARLLATTPNASGLPSEPDERVAAEQLVLGQAPLGPRLGWVLVLLGAFGLGVAGIVVWAHQLAAALAKGSQGASGRSLLASCRTGVGLSLIALSLWVLALWRA